MLRTVRALGGRPSWVRTSWRAHMGIRGLPAAGARSMSTAKKEIMSRHTSLLETHEHNTLLRGDVKVR
jgi:hypothetical protein